MTVAVNGKNGPKIGCAKTHLGAGRCRRAKLEHQGRRGHQQPKWEFSAKEEGGNGQDSLRITQQIAPAVPVTVQQASFTRISGKYEVAVTQPAGALPGKGGLEISAVAQARHATARPQALL
jgi:hypothetical protein